MTNRAVAISSREAFKLRQAVARFSPVMLVLATWAGTASPVWAEFSPDEQLLAQQIVDGLPPPPAGVDGSPALPPAQFPANSGYPAGSPLIVPAPSTTLPALPATSPAVATPSISPGDASQRYLVLVNGNSPLLLEQVRKVESGAFLQTFDGRQVIQAGVFADPGSAERQIQTLATQGIGADVVVVAAEPTMALANAAPREVEPLPELTPVRTTPAREVVFGQQPNFDGSTTADSRLVAAADSSYYVVIPGQSDDLPDINDQVVRLGEGFAIAQVVEERRSPLGPHVLVGPFVNRNAAERWNDYLRAFGMDARVYYRR
ncbi:hypothetical protein H6G89_28070 [Oscillatoria sp. FACHB-1407]|uniref:hypothetical protein n=1 Tax=Oscillatoria sp. FACHB-1407 TaxID=2692847 RepID=UPI001686FD48|nr:hypothetical protein [Oscillatoria sp. FACHB-1407]MBD2464864.1 hypothetical protein [Oscillatoria sp. FACHB-1407]